MPRNLRMVELDDGWTEWIHPLPGYRMSCCDCGLSHNMEFRIDDLGRINFRAQRNNRATSQIRRHMKKATTTPASPGSSDPLTWSAESPAPFKTKEPEE